MLQPVETALASFGLSGRVFHAPFLLRNQFYKLSTVLERSKNLSRTVIPDVKIVRTYDEILNNKNIELIIVNTPDHLHYDMVKKALIAGKHVVVEKPFTQIYEEAEELVNMADKLRLILTVYQNRRFDGDFLTLKRVLSEGTLGRIVEIESRMDRYSPAINSVWREDNAGRNGALYNLGSHMIDQIVYLFGKPDGVSAILKKQRPGSRINDFCDIRLLYKDLIATVKSSSLAAEPAPRFRVNGEKGSLIKYGSDCQEYNLKKAAGIKTVMTSHYTESMNLTLLKEGIAVSERISLEQGDYGMFYELLSGAIREGTPPPVSTEHMLLNMQLLEQAVKSSETGKIVKSD